MCQKRGVHCGRHHLLGAAVVGVFLLSILGAGRAAGGEKPVLVIFEFESPKDGGKTGKKVANLFRKKAQREGKYVQIDDFDLADIVSSEGFAAKLEDDPKKIRNFAKDSLGAHLVMWGKAERLGRDRFSISVKVMDLRKGVPTPFLDLAKRCDGFPAVSALSKEILASMSGKPAEEPKAETAPAPTKKAGPNLVANGDFEKGQGSPVHWDKVNGLTTFWVDGVSSTGKCLRIDTDVYESEVKAWEAKFKAGAPASKAPKKTPTKGPKYDTIGGTHGVHFYSDMLKVKPDTQYRISVDKRGPGGDFFFPKVFVKGYDLFTDEAGAQKREIYRAYLALRATSGPTKWQHYTRTFHPTKTTPDVKWMQVIIYAYWPPGEYWFDNVQLTEE